MGQKVHPTIFRIGTIYQAHSSWFSQKEYAAFVREDHLIRKFLMAKLKDAGLALVEIKRSAKKDIEVVIHTSRPGVIIGRGGSNAEELKKEIKHKFFASKKIQISLTIQEVIKPDLNAQLVCQNVIGQLEKRIPFRRAIKRAVEQVKRAGAKGVKIMASGRLNGAEIARRETFVDGSLPLHTIRADIDYGRGAAHTLYGLIGVKVWIYKGEIFDRDAETISFRVQQ